MTQQNKNAVKLLKELMQERRWYGDALDEGTARMLKTRAMRGSVSYKKAVETLVLLGWKKTAEEAWEPAAAKNNFAAGAEAKSVKKIRCKCPCHKQHGSVKHTHPCCDNGWITVERGQAATRHE